MTPYVSIDIETTGLDPSYCQVLEVGAVLETKSWETPVEQLSQFHCYVVHERIVGQPFALAMNADLLRTIAKRDKPGLYLEPHEVGTHLRRWLVGERALETTNGANIVAAGKNFASFDRQFLRQLPQFNVPFHHRSIEPGMFYWKPSTDNVPPDTKLCMERAGIAGAVAHTAIEDAIVVVKLIRETFRDSEPFFPDSEPVKRDGGVQLDVIRRPANAREVAEGLSADFLARGQFAHQ